MSERSRVHGKPASKRSTETRQQRNRRIVREIRTQQREDRAVRRTVAEVYVRA